MSMIGWHWQCARNNPFVLTCSENCTQLGTTAPPEYHGGGEKKSCVRRSSVVVVCNCSPDSDGESAGLAAKAASSKIYSHSTLSYSFKLGFVLRCDKHLRLSERCSLPDRQSRWLLDICTRCWRTN